MEKTWITSIGELAEWFGVSRNTASDWAHRRGFPNKSKLGWSVAKIDRFLELAELGPYRPEPGDDGEADPAMRGPSSPALEEFRKWRALREKLAYGRDCRLYAKIEDVHTLVADIASTLRRAVETLQKRFGRDARDIIADALTDALSSYERSGLWPDTVLTEQPKTG